MLHGNNWIKRFSNKLSPMLFIMLINYLIHLRLQLYFSVPLASPSSDILPISSSALLLSVCLVAGYLPCPPPGDVTLPTSHWWFCSVTPS